MTLCIPLWAVITVAGIVLVKWAVEAYLAVRVWHLLQDELFAVHSGGSSHEYTMPQDFHA